MNEEELFCKLFPDYTVNGKTLSPYFDLFERGYEEAENRIEQLEKENAGLKEKLKPENCLKSLAKSGLVKFTCENGNEHDQLTKAKELLREIIDTPVFNQMGGELYENEGYTELVAEAEQFLKE